MKLSSRCIVLGVILALTSLLAATDPVAAQAIEVSARFLDVGDTRSGRIHLSMRFQSPDDGHTLRIQDVVGDSSGIDYPGSARTRTG